MRTEQEAGRRGRQISSLSLLQLDGGLCFVSDLPDAAFDVVRDIEGAVGTHRHARRTIRKRSCEDLIAAERAVLTKRNESHQRACLEGDERAATIFAGKS